MSVPTELLADESQCLKLYDTQDAFAKLAGNTQGKILGQHPNIMKKALQDNRLLSLSSSAISKAVTLYTINVAEIRSGENGKFFYLGKNLASEDVRMDICFALAQNPVLIKKLNPAARILFFANLKKSPKFQDFLRSGDAKKLELSAEMISQIQHAYDIKTDYNPESDERYWNKNLWPAMAGNIGIGCELTRMTELWRITQTREDNYRPCSEDEVKATAEVLLTHSSFNNEPNNYGFANIYMRSNEDTSYPIQKKYDESRWIGCPFRYALGMQYKHCARLMIENPEYRGRAEGEITNRDLDTMAKKHGLESVLAEVRQKEKGEIAPQKDFEAASRQQAEQAQQAAQAAREQERVAAALVDERQRQALEQKQQAEAQQSALIAAAQLQAEQAAREQERVAVALAAERQREAQALEQKQQVEAQQRALNAAAEQQAEQAREQERLAEEQPGLYFAHPGNARSAPIKLDTPVAQKQSKCFS